MTGLYDVFANAQNGEAIDRLARQFNLTPQQTEEAVAALLPALSRGLKQSTETPEGLAGLLGMMAQENALPGMYDDDREAFGEQGRRTGNDVLGMIFGSKDVSRAVADQAQRASGIGSSILKQMLPVVIGMILRGLLKGLGGGGAQGRQMPAPQPGPGGGGLGDILGEILGGGRGAPGGGSPFPFPIPDGRGGQAPSGGGLGDILKDILGGGMGGGGRTSDGTSARDLKDLSDLSNKLPVAGGGLGEQVFGDLLEPGHDVDRRHANNIEQLLDSLLGGRGR
jgi:hypothetical protein